MKNLVLTLRGENAATFDDKGHVYDLKTDISVASLKLATKMLNAAFETGEKTVNLYTVLPTVLLYRQIRKLYNNGNDVINTVTSTAFYKALEDDTEKILALKEARREAAKDFAACVLKYLDSDTILNIESTNDFNRLYLNVPEEVQLKAGDKINLVLGETLDGITCPSWKNISRNNAEVFQDGQGRFYIEKRHYLSREDKVVQKAIELCWDKCPEKEVKIEFGEVAVI